MNVEGVALDKVDQKLVASSAKKFAVATKGKTLGTVVRELAAKLRDMGNTVARQGGIKPQGPVQNFFGGVHIKQDFKDQDPDRVILTFKKGLAGAASNRTTSRFSSPFGW